MIIETIKSTFQTGQSATSGTGKQGLTSSSKRARMGVYLRAKYDNQSPIGIGYSDSETFFPLYPGEMVFIPINDLKNIRLDVQTAGDDVYYLVI